MVLNTTADGSFLVFHRGKVVGSEPQGFWSDMDLRVITSCKEQPSEGHFYVFLGFTLF